MIVLASVLTGLTIWAIWFIESNDQRIAVFGIVALITATFTSVFTVSINNKKAKEREYELLVLKEKQKVYEHFYNSFFELFKNQKKSKQLLSQKATDEMMLFKKGLMNWGSERLIQQFIHYEDSVANPTHPLEIIEIGNTFLKEIRKEMGFSDSKDLNIMSIILTSEARAEIFGANQ